MAEASRRRAVYYAVSILALVTGLWAARGLQRLSELPADFPAAAIHYPARLDGVEVGSPGELRMLTQSRPIGSPVEVRSGDRVLRERLEPQITPLHFALVLLEGLAFFAVNLIVFGPRVERGPVRDFYWCTLLYGLAILVGGVYMPRGSSWSEWMLPAVWIACLAALPAFYLRVALSFPTRHGFLERHPRFPRLLFGIAALLFAAQTLGFWRYFADPGPSTWKAAAFFRGLAGAYLVVAVAAGCAVLYRTEKVLELSRERKQVKWLLWGFTIGVTPYVFLRTLPRLLGVEPPVSPELDRVLELAIPVAFTFAVIRHQLFDIDIIIRRSLIYGALAAVLWGVYLMGGVVAGRRLIARYPEYAAVIQAVAVAIPVALFHPTRRWIGRWVDRTFFLIQYNFAQALAGLQQDLGGASSQEEIAEICRAFTKEQLLLQRTAVIVARRGGLIVAGDLDERTLDEAARWFDRPFPESRGLFAAPNRTSRPELESEEFPDSLRRAGLTMLLAIAENDRARGLILAGAKISERRFVDEELMLLRSVRIEAAAALERVELVQIAAEEALEREKAQALDRMKSDFFSRVAHDLRTPVTSIRWTVQNLLDGIGGDPRPEHLASLRSIHMAAHQLGRLVDNLLDVSRLERPAPALRLQPVSMEEVVEAAVAAVEPGVAARGVRFEMRAEPGLGPVRGDPDRMHEVVINLLENAARYSPDGDVVEIGMNRGDEGDQVLTVRDHGPGLSEEDRERIFERFEQGRPSPYSRQRGFGLGLYIVRSYLERMGGSVRAENHPQGGAVFMCSLQEQGSDAAAGGHA